METQTSPNPEIERLAELIDGIEVAMLTTHAADGSLVSRPIQTLDLDRAGELIFFTAADSAKVAELTEHADVNLAYAHPGKQRFVSVRGSARLDRDRDTIDRLWSVTQNVFFPAGRGDPQLMVLRVRVRDAAWWDASENFIARSLDIARGLIGDKPADLGEHGHLDPGSAV